MKLNKKDVAKLARFNKLNFKVINRDVLTDGFNVWDANTLENISDTIMSKIFLEKLYNHTAYELNMKKYGYERISNKIYMYMCDNDEIKIDASKLVPFNKCLENGHMLKVLTDGNNVYDAETLICINGSLPAIELLKDLRKAHRDDLKQKMNAYKFELVGKKYVYFEDPTQMQCYK